MTKSEKIKKKLKETKEKRKNQIAKTYTLKIQNLSKEKERKLSKVFLEAKWFYNWAIHQENVFNIDGSKIDKVLVKVGDKFEEREIVNLGSQVKQEIIGRIKDNIKGLSKLKQNGKKIGRLKPKKRVNSIPFKQYGVSHRIDFKKNRVSLQKLGSFRVLGLHQIPANAELSSALLVRKPSGYYIHITCYIPKEKEEKAIIDKPIAIDFGIKDKITLSNGVKVDFEISESKRLKRLQRRLSRKVKGSKNFKKVKHKIAKEHEKISNKRNDVINRIVAISKLYNSVVFQNDNIHSWHKGWFSKAVQYSGIGKIKERLRSSLSTVLEVDRFEATSKICSECGEKLNITLSDRVIICPKCGYTTDRDLNACYVMLKKVSPALKVVGLDWSELTPVERTAYARILGSNPYVRVSYLVEAGSPSFQ